IPRPRDRRAPLRRGQRTRARRHHRHRHPERDRRRPEHARGIRPRDRRSRRRSRRAALRAPPLPPRARLRRHQRHLRPGRAARARRGARVSETPVPSLLATLFERLQGQEALDLELKLARDSVPQSLWPTVSAFANTLGGWVLLGIGEEEGKFVVEGVSNPQALLQNIANTLRNGQKISYPACGANDLKIESVDGKDVVVLRVPAAPRKARPVYINGNAYGGTYVRRQSGDYHCTKPEVDRMMREASDVAAGLQHPGEVRLGRPGPRHVRALPPAAPDPEPHLGAQRLRGRALPRSNRRLRTEPRDGRPGAHRRRAPDVRNPRSHPRVADAAPDRLPPDAGWRRSRR